MPKSLETLEQQRAKIVEQIVQLMTSAAAPSLPPKAVVANSTAAAINPTNRATALISA